MEKERKPELFGTVLGATVEGVEAYSSYDPAQSSGLEHSGLEHEFNGTFTGVQWQCVEFARRFLYATRGVTFGGVDIAKDIFELDHFVGVDTGGQNDVAVRAERNGSLSSPKCGDLLIWDTSGDFAQTGHVAVITDVFANAASENSESIVQIAEQNVGHVSWGGKSWARELKMRQDDDGGYHIECSRSSENEILGWMGF